MKLEIVKYTSPILESSVLKLNKDKVERGILYPVLEGELDYSAYVMLSGKPTDYFDGTRKKYYRALFHFGGHGFTPVISGKPYYTLKRIFVILVPEYGDPRTPLPAGAETEFFLSSSMAEELEGAAHWGKKDCAWKLKYADNLGGDAVEGKSGGDEVYLSHSTETNTTFYCPKKYRNSSRNRGDIKHHDAFAIDSIKPAKGLGSFAEATDWHLKDKKKWRFKEPD